MAISSLATKYKFENFGAVRWESRGNTRIDTIVVHHAATTNFDVMPDVWKSREASAHYGIGQKGEIRAYIDETKRAWHAGNENSRSIGIECTNTTGAPNWIVSDATVTALVDLIQDIKKRYNITRIIGHRDGVGAATACPGPSLYPRMQEIRNRVAGQSVASIPTKPAPTKSASTQSGSAAIREVQSWLNNYPFNNISVDGFNGPITKKAIIRAIQHELNIKFGAGLIVDGLWGPKTRNAWRTVRQGAKGNLTRCIQALLICRGYSTNGFDGDFGAGTADAAVPFQAAATLVKDSLVGRDMISKLVA